MIVISGKIIVNSAVRRSHTHHKLHALKWLAPRKYIRTSSSLFVFILYLHCSNEEFYSMAALISMVLLLG